MQPNNVCPFRRLVCSVLFPVHPRIINKYSIAHVPTTEGQGCCFSCCFDISVNVNRVFVDKCSDVRLIECRSTAIISKVIVDCRSAANCCCYFVADCAVDVAHRTATACFRSLRAVRGHSFIHLKVRIVTCLVILQMCLSDILNDVSFCDVHSIEAVCVKTARRRRTQQDDAKRHQTLQTR